MGDPNHLGSLFKMHMPGPYPRIGFRSEVGPEHLNFQQIPQVPLSTESENHSSGAHWPELHERSSASQRSCQGSPLSGDAELLVTAYRL